MFNNNTSSLFAQFDHAAFRDEGILPPADLLCRAVADRSGGPERREGFGAAEHNSGTKKEEVSRTLSRLYGYTPIAAYLGNEGWGVGLELRPGSKHSAFETQYLSAVCA
jgi:hypothetical protein